MVKFWDNNWNYLANKVPQWTKGHRYEPYLNRGFTTLHNLHKRYFSSSVASKYSNAFKKQIKTQNPKYSQKYRKKATPLFKQRRPIFKSGGRRRRGQIPKRRRYNLARKSKKKTRT